VIYIYMAGLVERWKVGKPRKPAAGQLIPVPQYDGGRLTNISQTFIERPIATSLLMTAIAMFGMVAYRSLPVSDLPNVDFPTLLVTASLPGASPENHGLGCRDAAREPVLDDCRAERHDVQQLARLDPGHPRVRFEPESRCAAVDVQAAITQAARLLPAGMPTPPTFTKVKPSRSADSLTWRSLRRRCRCGRSTNTPKHA